ncbi:DUF4259 domain-containing protein [Blastopirellula marina]|uniref:DUF4259 domain-containing protein n=1 Tax=Blastopirellula marina TaxID=124 RepID=A0A2S8FHP6_9BACT|nr:DUF4259 domain-containing protein [Blastopirellula marina]PQO31663.1 hypothetical protein C5Y98_19810 [Blastopirellula marina]PTL42970.1 DUF4259 domain-containing protein [Blastopirellula marina]
MGAWGHEIFDNDSACNWQDQLLAGDNIAPIQTALQRVIDAEDRVDADSARQALAACEALAHLRGRPGLQEAPLDALSAWANQHKDVPTDPLIPLAKLALPRIASDDCELKQAWCETDQFDLWLATVEDVARRVE